jgi:predicted ATP-grasp superfamily ATP-dependent carboligase
VYNEVAVLINQNGWIEDEITAKDVTAASAWIELCNSIIKDSVNVKADELQDVLTATDEMIKELDTNVRARVSVPFEEGGK